MAVIDRNILDNALDESAGVWGATYVYHNFNLSAQNNKLEDIIKGLEQASNNNPEMLAFTQALKDNPALGNRFHAAFRAEGGDLLDKMETLFAQDGTVTTENIRTFLDANDAAVSAGSNFNERFLIALGAERTTHLLQDTFKYGDTVLTDENDGPKFLRDIIADKTPDQMIDALIEASEGDQRALFEKMKEKGLAGPLHTAITGDETTLPEIQRILGATAGGDGFNIADLNKILDDPSAVERLGTLLTKVGDGSTIADGDNKGQDITFLHVTALLEDYKKGDMTAVVAGMNNLGVQVDPLQDIFAKLNINGIDDIINILMNPKELINMMTTAMPELANSNFFMGFIVPAMEMGGPVFGGQAQGIMNWAQRVGGAIDHSATSNAGRFGVESQNFQRNADGQTSNFTTDEFKKKFNEAMERFDRNMDNPDHVRAALIEADPRLADELGEILSNPTLTNKYNTSVRTGVTLESIGEFYRKITETHNVDYGVNALAR